MNLYIVIYIMIQTTSKVPIQAGFVLFFLFCFAAITRVILPAFPIRPLFFFCLFIPRITIDFFHMSQQRLYTHARTHANARTQIHTHARTHTHTYFESTILNERLHTLTRGILYKDVFSDRIVFFLCDIVPTTASLQTPSNKSGRY